MATEIIEFGNLKRRKLKHHNKADEQMSQEKLPPSLHVVAFVRACTSLSAQQRTKELVQSSCFTASTEPKISIEDYLTRIERYMPCSLQVFVYGFLLLDRFSQYYPFGKFELHRVVFVALVIAHKIVEDDNIRPYSRIGGIDKAELLYLELAFLNTLQWDVFLDSERVNWFCTVFLK